MKLIAHFKLNGFRFMIIAKNFLWEYSEFLIKHILHSLKKHPVVGLIKIGRNTCYIVT